MANDNSPFEAMGQNSKNNTMTSNSSGRGSANGPNGAPLSEPSSSRTMNYVAIEFDSISSSSTDVYDSDDWRSSKGLSTLPRAERNGPMGFIRQVVHNEKNGIRHPNDHGLEMNEFYTSKKSDRTAAVPPAESNGRRKLSIAFLQDMVPLDMAANTAMGTFMGTHLERALRLSHARSSKVTLGFINDDVEDDYQKYFWSTMKARWGFYIAVGACLALAIQIAGLLGNNGDGLAGGNATDWVVFGCGAILPLVFLGCTPLIFSQDRMSRLVHLVSLAFVIVICPVLLGIRYTRSHINSDITFNPSVTAPIYIVALISAVFFLRIRFIYTVVGVLVSGPTWWYVFSYAASTSERNSYILNSLVVLFASIVTCCVAFDIELSLRHQYLSNSRFLSITKNLQSQLDGLERSLLAAAADKNGEITADLSSPLERAMLAIRGLMADSSTSEEHLGVLELILACLSSPNLLTPDLDVQVKEGNVAIDDEQEKWLFNEVARRASQVDLGVGKEQISQFESFKFGEPSVLDTVPEVYDSRRPSHTSAAHASTKFFDTDKFDLILQTSETRGLLNRMNEFNFPIFDFARSTEGNPLLAMGHNLIVESGLLGRLKLDPGKFMTFLSTIEGGYHSHLAFHNSIHAADVLHCINYLSHLPTIRSIFTDLEMLAIYIAASIHDFDHPGVNNQYLIATSDRRALLYNDKSVLENHHCASAFEVLARKECAFLSVLDRADYKSFRDNVVDMVLATDLAQHFTLLTLFKKKVLAGDTFDPISTREDRSMLMQMLMKCSDVSNPTKVGPEYDEWIERLHQEWYMQGDLEKSLGLPISAFCNRDGPHASNPASSQTGFINFIVSPLYEAFSAYTPIGEVWDGLEFNKNRWAAASAPTTPATASSETPAKNKPKLTALRIPLSAADSLAMRSAVIRSPMRIKPGVGSAFTPATASFQNPRGKGGRSMSFAHTISEIMSPTATDHQKLPSSNSRTSGARNL